jgi:hypothetical protein
MDSETFGKGNCNAKARKEEKRAAKLSAENTFEAVAREWHANQNDGWTSGYAE